MGSLITTAEAERVERAVAAASAGGARVLTGGQRDGAMVAPTVVADVDPASPFNQTDPDPAVVVSTAEDRETAIAKANSTGYGLAAGIFTRGCGRRGPGHARGRGRQQHHLNWTPLWRADLMPYGGLTGSGIGKEGPRAAVAEMTESKTIVLHGRPS